MKRAQTNRQGKQALEITSGAFCVRRQMKICVENNYWTALSKKYQSKVKAIAWAHNVDTETTMRNLESFLRNELATLRGPEVYCSHKSFITMRELEGLIDSLSRA